MLSILSVASKDSKSILITINLNAKNSSRLKKDKSFLLTLNTMYLQLKLLRFFCIYSMNYILQANKVRELKAQGAAKDVVAPEIDLLLKLKKDLAIAQGVDPSASSSGGKKNKGKSSEQKKKATTPPQGESSPSSAKSVDAVAAQRLEKEVAEQVR